MARVIVDTGFLSSILKVRLVDTTMEIIDEEKLFITEKVEEELKKCRLYASHREKISDTGPIAVEEFELSEGEENLSLLGEGERSCIHYCLKDDARLLIDDREAREKAQELDIKTLTIPDLLYLGKRLEKIDKKEMKEIIKKLKKNDNYSFSDEVKEELLDYP